LDFPVFDSDRAELIAEATSKGLTHVFVPGVEPAQWFGLAALKRVFPSVCVGIGVHPWFVHRLAPELVLEEALVSACELISAVAIGETGLDRLAAERGGAPMAKQLEVFEAHLRIAKQLCLPLVLHVVRAHGAALELLQRYAPYPAGGVLHSYSGSAEFVPRYVALNFHLSFSGAVTRPNAKRAQSSAKVVPIERLLLETDAPDQPPVGFVGRVPGRNEPVALVTVAEFVAQLRNTSPGSLLDFTRENALRLYRL
jgi:TatD DNase family protein